MTRQRQIRSITAALALLLAITAATYAQPALEQRHSALIEAFAAAHAAPGHDENALREYWTPKLAEQFVFSFPDEGWGWKRASNSRPLASDAIARRVGGKIWAYDVILSAGTSGWRLDSHARPLDISDQVFVPMPGVNHLEGGSGGGGPGNGGGTTDPPSTVDLTRVLQELVATREAQQQTLTALIAMAQALDRIRELQEEQKNQGYTTHDELRQARAALTAAIADAAEKLRAQVAGGVRIRF